MNEAVRNFYQLSEKNEKGGRMHVQSLANISSNLEPRFGPDLATLGWLSEETASSLALATEKKDSNIRSPEIQWVGLIGFDAKQQTFILLPIRCRSEENTDPKTTLSSREQEVLQLVATGQSNKQIAHHLVISRNTVKVHLRNIFEKLSVASRTEAVLLAMLAGWINLVEVIQSQTYRPI